MPTYYHNETLFSEIYLEEITRQTENADVLASLKVLGEYREFADTHSLRAWKESYVHEVLSALGFFAKSKNEALTQLFPMGNAGNENPLSLCYVVLPDENLDNTTIGRNWAEKIIRALRENNLQWGLLTNGKQWRIYHLNESTPYETYLEIDLEAILKEKAKEAYQIFHKFMKAENFTIQEDGKCRFDRFKKESQDKIDYIEKELANALRQREEGGKGVLSDLCMGYVEELRHRNEGNLDDEALRKKIYHGAMLYMFRLLFLFYADARRLLSDKNHVLLEKVEAECRAHHDGGSFGESSLPMWNNLEQIFVDIDQTYNGGLFSPQESEFTRFLSDTRIGDNYITSVIFNLTTYQEKNGQEKPISYRDMSVRHLGTLYEGLLEHKLYIAKEDTEVKVAKGVIQFIPVSQGGKRVVGHYIKEGEVYFAGDPSERKSTGSYYTPEYIVDYLVRNTVGGKLNKLKEAFFTEQFSNLEARQQAVDDGERAALTALLEENVLAFVREQVLNLSVLDPAMGSGHFLVNATNLISNFVTETLNELGVESNSESSTVAWRRWVVENCIYGVDLNPLAVELAKLSLWILSMAKNQPLSFMNHHLKCGNSLVGARLDEIGNYPFSTTKKTPQQLHLFERDPDFKAAVEEAIIKSRLIAGKASASLEDVREKKTWLEEIDQILEGYKAICDVHTSLYFGNFVEESKYMNMVKQKDVHLAQSLSIANQYFHWELEFPEICLSRGGFTCITCNPPYDTFKENTYFKKEEAAGCGNLFGHFITKAAFLNVNQGSIGFIVPLSFACGSSYENVRETIYRNYHSLYSSHYSKRPNMLFDGVQQRITIFVAHSKSINSNCQVFSSRLWRWKKEDQEWVVRNPELALVDRINSGVIPKVGSEIGSEIYRYVKKSSKKLGELFLRDGSDDFVAYYHNVAMYWIKAYDFLPYFKREKETSSSISSKLKTLRFRNEFDKNLFLLIMNSSIFYYWWIAQGDEFDVLISEASAFGIYNYDNFRLKSKDVFALVKELMDDYQLNSVTKSTALGGATSFYQEFYPRKSRHIINRIDDFISPIYGLSDEQNRFLKEYDLIWRTDEGKEQ
ncbi:MAG: Eco57I restriction-modification methylase domain-containing protein [Chloroflexi bacterium]|nr:Eco57I restriction-modification methylase domain-containing protein [Chloroflexota bacterium]